MATTVQLTFPDDEQAREFVRAATLAAEATEPYTRGAGVFFMPDYANEAEDVREVHVENVKVVG